VNVASDGEMDFFPGAPWCNCFFCNYRDRKKDMETAALDVWVGVSVSDFWGNGLVKTSIIETRCKRALFKVQKQSKYIHM